MIDTRLRWAVPVIAMLGLAAQAPAPAAPLGFAGATLGMSLADWKAQPPPADAGPGAEAVCTPQPAAGQVSCGYDSEVGRTALPRALRLDKRYLARGVAYMFNDGRLTEIRFQSSVDAYNDVMAMLTKRYGPPSHTARDSLKSSIGRLQRVHQVWRTPDGVVTLADPAPTPAALTVRLEAAGASG
ncbi:MAG TPA: hypothetical protein VGG29_11965 [Caulobacteraceae bacterium]|jgi:hypothetical protein